ncbi:anthranilate synthase component I family protein [uncultured Kriegella sp.]|uniref:anthranilate synthase component I family protein n=1 Tax=uncultured Kriegella sp. TaxID=1798910 RepID=UPI0030D98C82
MRTKVSFIIADVPNFKDTLLYWAGQFKEAVWLDSNNHNDVYGTFDAVLAVDALTSLTTDAKHGFDNLKEYQERANDWLFGYLSYDLKNDVEQLGSANFDGLHFPELHFFQPKKIIRITANKADFIYLNMVGDEIEEDFKEISKTIIPEKEPTVTEDIHIRLRTFKDEYFRRIDSLLAHIHRGDIYEANFCQEFYAENTVIDAFRTYLKLNAISKPPFAVFLKLEDKYLLSASPERYLKKVGSKIISQPIKGTARRSSDAEMDTLLKHNLALDEKERAENIMIVDLVRNDLSKSAEKGTVVVDELCKVYTFSQVHQMISTISASVHPDKNPVDVIRETFPMGSMTGAPKISAMKIIEAQEAFKRGLYSGAVGYFTPDGDFDFNVVIRSILYNATQKYVSYSVGGAITAQAVPEKEYEECLLKAKAMREVLED